jgi:hypothetical protein
MVMDLTGNENFQLWYDTQALGSSRLCLLTLVLICSTVHRRYWEDTNSDAISPKIDGELDNRPEKGALSA